MKNILKLNFLVIIAFYATSVNAQKKAKIKIEQGYKISWNLSLGYDFSIDIQNVTPYFDFNWFMSTGSNGKVIITQNALKSAVVQVNNFENGTKETYDNKTTVLVSNFVYNSLKNNKEVVINPDGNNETLRFKENQKMIVKVDGKDMQFNILYAETEKNKKYWIWDNETTPLIFKMDLGWVLELKSITTNKKSKK